MVKIRLRRIGAKGRPFYRMVVANSTCARNGAFIENIGTYNPVEKPTRIEVNSERALHWLLQGARPTDTTAYLLNKVGVLEKFFEQRPGARKNYAFLDKTTSVTLKKSAVDVAFEASTSRESAEPKAEITEASAGAETATPSPPEADATPAELTGPEPVEAPQVEAVAEEAPEPAQAEESAIEGSNEPTKEGE